MAELPVSPLRFSPMRIFRSWPIVAGALMLSACVASNPDATPTTTLAPAADVPSTSAPDTTTTTAETTTTTLDPTAVFLETVTEAPSLTAFTDGGFRSWQRIDDAWSPGPLTRYVEGPFDIPPMGASTPSGVVYASPEGTIHLVLDDDDLTVPSVQTELYDVAVAGDTAFAIVGPEGVVALDTATGESEPVFDARLPVESASYGGGQLLVIQGTGAEALASLVDRQGRSARLDLLADGNPVSAVLSPDGGSMFFSTDASDDGVVYTLAIGSQGPAAPFPLDLPGPVTRLDTDGVWVAGIAGRNAFLLDTSTGDVFPGPSDVRFVFDRTDRTYLGSGATRIIDGRFFGWVRSATPGSIQFDEAEFLTGDDAAVAAEAAGEESPPPNDYFIRNTSEDTSRIPVAEGVEVRVQASYPEAGVDWESVTREVWLRLLAGDLSAVDFEWYGQGTLPYWITIEEGEAILLEEVYLP